MIRKFHHASINTLFDSELGTLPIMSFGASSYGYDARLDRTELHVFRADDPHEIIDPKRPKLANYKRQTPHGGYFVIPGLTYALGRSAERFNIPRDVTSICVGKSTYARAGLIVNITPLEAGWRGEVTIELHNTCPNPMRVYAGEGICQFLFLRSSTQCQTSYADRKGKYQDQQGIQIGRV